MHDTEDIVLLGGYVDTHSESAFAGIVQRHINLVYSAALRFTGNSEDAQDVTQAVFVILAKKAAGLRSKTTLTGWLYETTRFTAMNFLTNKSRRQTREQEAYRRTIVNDAEAANVWSQIAPLLENAMSRLNEKDRMLIALRFFENKTIEETAALIGINEWAARKRVERTMEKLRAYFSRRGITSTAATVAGAISANSIQAAPAALAQTATAVAITKGTAASGSTLTLIQGALKIMAWTKAKTAIAVGIGVLLAAGTATVTVEEIKVHETNRDAWRSTGLTWQQVGETPPQVRILPTKFKPPVHNMQTCDGTRWGGIRVSVREILRASYRAAPGRVIFPAGEPQEKYDFISTLSHGTEEALRRELKNTLGFVGRSEVRDTDALALEVRNPDADGLKLAFWMPDEYGDLSHGHIHCFGEGLSWSPPMPPWGLTKYLEMIFQKPVVDKTGLTGFYNLDLRWKVNRDPQANQAALKQALLDQLGLELVPTNMPVEMLIVEKSK